MAGDAVDTARLATYTGIRMSLNGSDADELKLSDIDVEVKAVPAPEPAPTQTISPAGAGDHSLPSETGPGL
jgi:hypothetical protein